MKPKTLFWIAVTGFGLLAFGLICPPIDTHKRAQPLRIHSAVNNFVSVTPTSNP